MRRPPVLVMALLAVGCHGKNSSDDGAALLDTGWFTTPVDPVDPEHCPDQFAVWYPADGDTTWYWRDRPRLLTGTANQAAYDAWLQTDDGERIDTTMVWDEATGLSFTLEWDGYLESNTTYTLGFQDCAKSQTVTFTTSSLGEPLDGLASELTGNTYLLDLVGAEWVQPLALAGVLATYFNTPVLLGVRYADSTRIDLIGAPGKTDTLGSFTQDTTAPTWDFPMADFSASPFLDVTAPEISFLYSNGDTIEVPVEDFVLTATFSSDGTVVGGGVLSGLGDSRYLGTELFGGDANALCVFAEGLGVDCVPCADGQPYCLKMVAKDIGAVLLPDLVLQD